MVCLSREQSCRVGGRLRNNQATPNIIFEVVDARTLSATTNTAKFHLARSARGVEDIPGSALARCDVGSPCCRRS